MAQSISEADLKAFAVAGIRSEVERMTKEVAELTTLLHSLNGASAEPVVQPVEAPTPKRAYRRRNRMSPEARERMSKMMKARWAARRKAAR